MTGPTKPTPQEYSEAVIKIHQATECNSALSKAERLAKALGIHDQSIAMLGSLRTAAKIIYAENLSIINRYES